MKRAQNTFDPLRFGLTAGIDVARIYLEWGNAIAALALAPAASTPKDVTATPVHAIGAEVERAIAPARRYPLRAAAILFAIVAICWTMARHHRR